MVIFHEGEHPRAAVRAAQSHPAAGVRAERRAGRQLRSASHARRVNTGLALLGATKIEGRAGTRWTYTASGLTTNIAARLASMAEAGRSWSARAP